MFEVFSIKDFFTKMLTSTDEINATVDQPTDDKLPFIERHPILLKKNPQFARLSKVGGGSFRIYVFNSRITDRQHVLASYCKG
jgi:hypothetical protein